MSDIEKALPIIYELEFNNDPEKFLHKHDNEDGFTLGGIYQKANPYTINWKKINHYLKITSNDIKRVSKVLYYDDIFQNEVKAVYKHNYWDRLKLDKVESQHIANEIFCFAVLSGVRTGAKLVQKMLGLKEDGIIGKISLEHLNVQDEKIFNVLFDKYEIEHFEKLVDNNEKFAVYKQGWINRSNLV